MERRLTTIVAADLVGYSRLMAADEEGVITRFRAARSKIVDPELKSGGGRIIKTMGDGLLVEFSSPVDAVRTSLAIQRAMVKDQADTPESEKLRFRIGINLGDVVIDGEDILGDGVNVAARLESLAPAGGICISRTVHDQIHGKTDAPLVSLGPQQVKNIPNPVETWRVEIDGVSPEKTGRETAERPSIAVLPFDNMSSDPEQEFLADGIVEDVITELSRFRSLFVIARNTTFAYKGTHKDVREIAGEIGVRYIVEGSVRRAGNRLRVTAQLIEAETGAHVWAERWDRTMEDLFDLQDEITSAIVTGVEPELGAHERAIARRKPTESLTAWQLCQKGYSEFTLYTDEGFKSAFELFHAAIRADPEFALPQALLARWYWVRIVTGRTTDFAADVGLGLQHAQNAIAIDDRLDGGYIGLGVMLAFYGREQDAQEAIDKALSLNPNNSVTYHARAITLLYHSNPDCDAMENATLTGVKLSPKDPLAWVFHFNTGNARFFRNFDLAEKGVREAYEAASRYPNADYFVLVATACANVAAGYDSKAKQYLDEALKKRPQLTLAAWRAAFRFPLWPKMLVVFDPVLEKLVGLGLPRE